MQYKNWTLEVVNREKRSNAYALTVKAVKGTEVKDRLFEGIISFDGLKQAAMNWIDSEERLATVPGTGVIDFTPPTPETPTPPTQDEIDREAWLKDWQRLQKVVRLSEHGVEILSAAQKTALVAKVRTGFKAEYQDLV
jgi:hypothetical protein